jgi:hypothetical protein
LFGVRAEAQDENAPVNIIVGRAAMVAALLCSEPAVGMAQDAEGTAGNIRDTTNEWQVRPDGLTRPIAYATRSLVPIVVDGRLDEAAWQDAHPISNFIQARPRPGDSATERTEVRILYDSTHLYIGAIAYDSEPRKLTIPTLERDFGGRSSEDGDVFAVSLDTFWDRQNSFTFFVNPAGAVKAGQTYNDSRESNYAWNGAVKVKTTIHDSGWTVEMSIPFTVLRFNARLEE